MGTTELTAAGVGAGDEVVLPAFGGAHVAEAVRELGARPVCADIDPRSFCLDPDAVEAVLTERTAAVVPVHLFGRSADMGRLAEVAGRAGARLVEWEPAPRADSVDAVRRRQYAAYFDRRLRGVVIPPAPRSAEHAYTSYVVRVPGNGRPDRDVFKRALRARGVECQVPVKAPVHWMPGFRQAVHLAAAESAAEECLALPLSAAMTKRELQHVVSACNALGGLMREEPAC
ncbi:DegT/DnrJ/EryC1/StrS family aminotransferase [Streptomyces boncukensis]|uniref:DegT/DnrJ/EryC1/StrS aminotransferase n=1 Tax=Streptomyces boncukensis TaxID=2711219 RepID=A0A6G4X7J4_9ACTN|nr:DegT/DnrJ/EryC1/StrS family aminotransferase [Streptomyces boncukensis]NGO73112.1 DegT/DnrJ/EryC1/StrS aminotransferase [Streptomyces boncukensis]